ncbi:MAG: amidohydrolase [Acidobacteria bacterium]|nr:amidohydrolase [Acidobacteriota bacterium]
MQKRFQCVVFSLILLSSVFQPLVLAQKPSTKTADLVLQNGAIYTVDAVRSWAQAVAIADGKIVYVGNDNEAKKFIGASTRVIDLQGKMVLPGFHDSHVHPISSGIELGECNLSEAKTVDEILDLIRRFAASHPTEKWIRGSGWQLPVFENGNPHKALLDKIVADRPVFLSAADGHSAWANSRALAIAGINQATPDPVNGRIERDPKSGEPTGTLRESATRLVTEFLPDYSDNDYLDGLRRALKLANAFGITSFQDASVDENELKTYAALDQRGELTARVNAAMYVSPTKGLAQIANLKALQRKYQSPNVRINSVKIFADGVIEPHTAALLEPYVGLGEERGKANWEASALNQMVAALDREGFQIHIHAIGDRAVRMALDAFAAARTLNGIRDSRHHIAHLELINPADIERFRKLNVIANFQPLWAYADPYITKLTEPFLGAERSRWLYPIGSVVKSGAVVVCGSDWSVSSLNPLDAMQVAVTRRGLEEGEGAAWHQEELVDLPTVLAGYTINGAYVNFQEREVGSIEVGKAADVIVLERNLFEVAKTEIHQARVLLTLLKGKELYRAANFDRH